MTATPQAIFGFQIFLLFQAKRRIFMLKLYPDSYFFLFFSSDYPNYIFIETYFGKWNTPIFKLVLLSIQQIIIITL